MMIHPHPTQPLVSCIMIFLNAGEPFFIAAIESIIQQTYGNWELLLVDDGSTDISSSIATRYATQYPGRIRYLDHPQHQNCGMSASRNLGIKHAQGEFITFLDADDAYFPEQINQQVELLLPQPTTAMVWGRTEVWFSWNEQSRDRDCYSQFGLAANQLIQPPTLLPNLLDSHERSIPCVCSVMVRRSVLIELGGFEDQFRSKFEDSVFWIKVFAAKPVLLSDNIWGQYRQHQTNSCVIANQTGHWQRGTLSPARETYLNWVASYFRAIEFDDAKIWRKLNQELWGYQNQHLYQFWRRIKLHLSQFKQQIKRTIINIPPISS
jgi:glycosyltransferase involved in cell wall biosynthesis